MKKLYETPSVERLAFRYRDQVVAASGGVSAMAEDPTEPSLQDLINNLITEGLSWEAISAFLSRLFG